MTTKLPRTRILANKNLSRNTRTAKSNLKKDMTALNTICDKYNVKELTFRSVQFITTDGTITTVQHNTIKGNINNGIFLIESPSTAVTLNQIYDIVKIKDDKKNRDLQKKIEAQNKSKPEVERLNKQIIKDLQTLKAANTTDDQIDNLVNIAENAVDELAEKVVDVVTDNLIENEIADKVTDLIENEIADKVTDLIENEIADKVTDLIENEVADEMTDTSIEKVADESINLSDQTAANNVIQPKINKKTAKMTGNKFFRNFMKDIKGKFRLSFQDEYEYCEFRKEATDLVVEGVNIHKINIPNDVLSYYIVIGNMQMKRIVIKQIDPAYGADDIIDEHNEFMNKVQKTNDDVPDLVNID
uniref:Uncharacterized protein n=1 Tax=viral metagenome TaxID=1070528 RepID=A0A6C0CBQ1_9ZZZZ